jgi:hypothetical protein
MDSNPNIVPQIAVHYPSVVNEMRTTGSRQVQHWKCGGERFRAHNDRSWLLLLQNASLRHEVDRFAVSRRADTIKQHASLG